MLNSGSGGCNSLGMAGGAMPGSVLGGAAAPDPDGIVASDPCGGKAELGEYDALDPVCPMIEILIELN